MYMTRGSPPGRPERPAERSEPESREHLEAAKGPSGLGRWLGKVYGFREFRDLGFRDLGFRV